MALSFAGLSIPGTHARADAPPPRIMVNRTHFAGLNGEVENFLGVAGRPIIYFITIHHASLTTDKKIVDLIRQFETKIGTHGELKQTGNNARTYKNVTFDGFQQTSDILKDYAATLNQGVQGYFVQGMLHFYQLYAGDDK